MKKQIVLLAFALMTASQVFAAREDLKMVCNLDVTSVDGNQEILQSEQMYRTTESQVTVVGQVGEVALGYERYKAVLTNEAHATLVQLFDGETAIAFQRIPSYQIDFAVSGIIENLKFNKLNLECAGALILNN